MPNILRKNIYFTSSESDESSSELLLLLLTGFFFEGAATPLAFLEDNVSFFEEGITLGAGS